MKHLNLLYFFFSSSSLSHTLSLFHCRCECVSFISNLEFVFNVVGAHKLLIVEKSPWNMRFAYVCKKKVLSKFPAICKRTQNDWTFFLSVSIQILRRNRIGAKSHIQLGRISYQFSCAYIELFFGCRLIHIRCLVFSLFPFIIRKWMRRFVVALKICFILPSLFHTHTWHTRTQQILSKYGSNYEYVVKYVLSLMFCYCCWMRVDSVQTW